MKAIAIALATVAACAADPAPTAQTEQPERTLWRCWTHALCEGVKLDQPHDLCLAPSEVSWESAPGELAAADFRQIWIAACTVQQGQMLNQAAPHACVRGDGEQGAWGCDATCIPLYRGCP